MNEKSKDVVTVSFYKKHRHNNYIEYFGKPYGVKDLDYLSQESINLG